MLDVALMLDYDNTKQAIILRINVHKDNKINISKLLNNEDPQTIFTRSDESGFYSIILSSKNEEAIQF